MRISFIIFLLISSYCRAQNDTLNRVDSTGKRHGYWIITGKMKNDSRYKPNAKVEEGIYLNNQKTGLWIGYYPSGVKESELIYVKNRPNGHAIMYDERGHISEEGNWIGTRWAKGKYTLYYPNDSVRWKFYYDNMGRRDSTCYWYYENGRIQAIRNYKNGILQGWTREYCSDGCMWSEVYYKFDHPDTSRMKTFDCPCKKADAQAGGYQREGEQAYTPYAGQLQIDVPMRNGDTIPKSDSTKQHPKNSNPWGIQGSTILYKNGQIYMIGIIRDGKLIDGEQRIYDVNGILIRRKAFRNGVYVGDLPLEE